MVRVGQASISSADGCQSTTRLGGWSYWIRSLCSYRTDRGCARGAQASGAITRSADSSILSRGARRNAKPSSKGVMETTTPQSDSRDRRPRALRVSLEGNSSIRGLSNCRPVSRGKIAIRLTPKHRSFKGVWNRQSPTCLVRKRKFLRRELPETGHPSSSYTTDAVLATGSPPNKWRGS